MQTHFSTYIREIFESIQGEGPYVGEKHIFVRFCRCNLGCKFCDTDFALKNSKVYDIDKLYEILKNINCNTISFTGGEPLLDVDFLFEFLSKYKTKLNKKIYLETNGTLFKELNKIIDFVDIVSMDIKLESATGQKEQFQNNEIFLRTASKKETFIKVVFDQNITNNEILSCVNLAKKYNTLIVLQPKMPMDKDLNINKIFNQFYLNYQNVRLIPQVHKFLNLL